MTHYFGGITMTKPPSRTAGYKGLTRDLVARDGQVCFLCGHKHATVHTLQADPINRDKDFELDNLIVACKPCAKRRNGKPIGAYWHERLSAAAAEIAHIEVIGRNKEVILSLREASVPVAKGPTTPNAVGITGSTVPTRAPRFYDYTNMAYDDSGDDGRPLDVQHLDVFADEHARGEGGFKVYLVEDGEGAWKSMKWAVKNDKVPEGWETSDKLAIWPDTEADADYASRITTPNAVDGTGSTDEDVMKDLLDRYNDA